MDAVMATLNDNNFAKAMQLNMVFAYEPVWAVGTGKTAMPEQAQQIHQFIRERIARRNAEAASKVRIIYGGSVKAQNAAKLFGMPDVDGGLVGGASLNADEFIEICQLAN